MYNKYYYTQCYVSLIVWNRRFESGAIFLFYNKVVIIISEIIFRQSSEGWYYWHLFSTIPNILWVVNNNRVLQTRAAHDLLKHQFIYLKRPHTCGELWYPTFLRLSFPTRSSPISLGIRIIPLDYFQLAG